MDSQALSASWKSDNASDLALGLFNHPVQASRGELYSVMLVLAALRRKHYTTVNV